jgi:hypothetical protein
MAHKFFLICAGMFLLALSYHLGANTATAQSGQIDGGCVVLSGLGNGWRASGVVGRDFYTMMDNGSSTTLSPAIPGSQPIVDTDPMGRAVLLGDGEVLKYTGSGWVAIGSIFSGPVPALRESWGQVKARYHATSGMTVTPRPNDR